MADAPITVASDRHTAGRSRIRRWLALVLSPAFAGLWLGGLIGWDQFDQVLDPWRMVHDELILMIFYSYLAAPLIAAVVLLGLRLLRSEATAPKVIAFYSFIPGLLGALPLTVWRQSLDVLWAPVFVAAVLWPTPLAYCLIAGVPWRRARKI